MPKKNYISWQDIDKLTKTLIRKIGKTKSLPESVFSLISLLDQSSFLDLLILNFGYFPVIIILKYFINATIVIYIIIVYKLLIKCNYVTII